MISIVIPTFNRNALLTNHLTRLRQELVDCIYEVIIINDYKKAEVELPEYLSEYTIINNPKSGVASARNLGASFARYDWILFLDDDMSMGLANFKAYEKELDRDEKFVMNMDWIFEDSVNKTLASYPFGRYFVKYGFNSLRGWNNYPDWTENSMNLVQRVASNNLLIKKHDFEEIGGYNEKFPFAGAEDFDFSERLVNAGFKLYIDTSSQMYHNEFDRLELREWLLRQYRGSVTRRLSYDIGYQQQYVAKSWKYSFPNLLNSLAYGCYKLTSKSNHLDKLNFKLINVLLGQSIHAGFHDQPYRLR